ncbi:sulfatase [Rubrobacter aplysinae]|uniref:sulfatase n=1 Tax=Rubrobacter aplysinae TaxID=909625 RepID=UPI00064C2A43|nr:sulfatase [Rubrobacter aplysinae]
MNVVVVCLDSLRKDHVGVYGNDWIKTPNLDALAGDSMRFTRAYPESIPTICARRAVFTGKRTWPFRGWMPTPEEVNFSAGWQPMPEDQVSVAETLSDNGYRTALITDNYHYYKPSYNFQRGFDVFDFIRGQEMDKYRSGLSVPERKVESYTVPGNYELLVEKARQYLANVASRDGEEDYFSPKVFARAMDYLDTVAEGDGEPFFLVVDSFDPHEPWDPPQSYVDLYASGYAGREPTVPNYDTSDYLTGAQLERMKTLYSAEVTMADKWFGDFVNKMEDLGLMEDTLLLVFSDHGVALGEHGYTGKPFNVLWPEMTDIIYYVRHPEGKGAGETSDFYASTHDIAPTVLATLGVPQKEQMDGQDLTPVLEGGPPEEERPHFTLGYDEYSWCRDEDYAMFCVNDLSAPKLYDLRQDPEMKNNIAGENPDVVQRMYEDFIVADAGGEPPPLREEATERARA